MTLQFITVPSLGIVEVVNTANDAVLLVDSQEQERMKSMQLDPERDTDVVRYLKQTDWIHPLEPVNIEWITNLF